VATQIHVVRGLSKATNVDKNVQIHRTKQWQRKGSKLTVFRGPWSYSEPAMPGSHCTETDQWTAAANTKNNCSNTK